MMASLQEGRNAELISIRRAEEKPRPEPAQTECQLTAGPPVPMLEAPFGGETLRHKEGSTTSSFLY